ncbi:MAG: hypothetical protein Q8L23_07105 [Caulobacter sp.]|nr:hypothetical protein [Caulobacter sp.]
MNSPADQAVLACIRVPKSGSKSLSRIVAEALSDRTSFYLPDTLRREARISRWQAFRLWRSQAQNLSKHWGVTSLAAALAKIDAAARPGDLLIGGHFDQPTVQAGLSRPVRSIVLLREPADRARSDYNYARQGFLKKKPWQRFDAHLTAQAAGRYGFEGFLDYQLEHPEVFGDLACAYIGWRPGTPLESVLPTIFCWGVLEEAGAFAARMSDLAGRPLTFGVSNATREVEQLDISTAERARIERLYARDLELYARCRADYS